MIGACPNCLAREGRLQKVQQDRPCPRCSYTGEFNGWMIFTDRKLNDSLVSEAGRFGAWTAEQIIAQQEALTRGICN